MDMEGSRWVEVTLEDTATSPAWEATMTTVRFNFVHFCCVFLHFSHFSGSHTFIPVLLQIARVEWTAVIMAAAADQSAWMAWEGAGACRCSWRNWFECWVFLILLRPSCFCSLWRWLWEESDSLPSHLYWTSALESVLNVLLFLRWRVSRWAQVMAIVLYPTSHACKYPPDISFWDCRTLASYGTRCGISTFYNAERTLLKLIFKINWNFFFLSGYFTNAYFNFHYCRCCNLLCWFVFDFSWLINVLFLLYAHCFLFSVCHCKNYYVKTKVQQLISKDQSQLA